MKPTALVLAGVALACASSARFSSRLPDGLPDMSHWEKMTGSADLEASRNSVEYELYVSPARPGVYTVTRYRITPRFAPQPSPEKLQWDKDGRDVRRYECAPETPSRAHPCRWKELSRGSAEYDRELSGLLGIYNLHTALLRQREDNARR